MTQQISVVFFFLRWQSSLPRPSAAGCESASAVCPAVPSHRLARCTYRGEYPVCLGAKQVAFCRAVYRGTLGAVLVSPSWVQHAVAIPTEQRRRRGAACCRHPVCTVTAPSCPNVTRRRRPARPRGPSLSAAERPQAPLISAPISAAVCLPGYLFVSVCLWSRC